MGKRLSGYKQKALGRQTLKYAFDVVPFSVGKQIYFSQKIERHGAHCGTPDMACAHCS